MSLPRTQTDSERKREREREREILLRGRKNGEREIEKCVEGIKIRYEHGKVSIHVNVH